MWRARETILTFSVMYLSPLTPEVYLLVYPFFKVICYHIMLYVQWIAFKFGRDKEKDQ